MKYILLLVIAIGMMACQQQQVKLLANGQVVEVSNVPSAVNVGDTIILEQELFNYRYTNTYIHFKDVDTVFSSKEFIWMYVKGVVVAP